MRRAHRLDANHHEISTALVNAGAQVQCLAGLGCGVPDLLVCYQGRTFLVEVKDGSKPPSERKLTDDERKFARWWKGEIAVVSTVEEARACLVK